MEPQQLPSPGVEAPLLSCGVLPSRQQYHIGDYPGTPPPSVYQVTHGTALQAAERHVRHLSYEEAPHRSKVIVSSLQGRLILYCLRQLFCFVAFLSASKADQTDVEGQTGKLAYVAEHAHQTAKA